MPANSSSSQTQSRNSISGKSKISIQITGSGAVTIEGTAVQTNGSITRYSYTMVANYELSDIHSGKEVTKGIESTVSAYDVVASPYATLVAQQDAQKLGARDIADRIRIDLGVYFSKRSSS